MCIRGAKFGDSFGAKKGNCDACSLVSYPRTDLSTYFANLRVHELFFLFYVTHTHRVIRGDSSAITF